MRYWLDDASKQGRKTHIVDIKTKIITENAENPMKSRQVNFKKYEYYSFVY